MIKILFICHGNICRSPMAEFFMKSLVKTKHIEDNFYIASAATSTEEIGNPVYPPVRRILEKRGLSCQNKKATRVKKADYDEYDYLICMDNNNVRNLYRIIGEDKNNKVFKLLDFTGEHTDVADPWYTGDFSATENDIERGCDALLKFILKNNATL